MNGTTPAHTTRAHTTQQLAEGWIAFWNGDTDLAATILSSDFRIHLAGTHAIDIAADDRRGPGDMADTIRTFRTGRPQARFELDGSVIADGQEVCGTAAASFATVRWSMSGPGLDVSGIDVLCLVENHIAEVWSVTGQRRY